MSQYFVFYPVKFIIHSLCSNLYTLVRMGLLSSHSQTCMQHP